MSFWESKSVQGKSTWILAKKHARCQCDVKEMQGYCGFLASCAFSDLSVCKCWPWCHWQWKSFLAVQRLSLLQRTISRLVGQTSCLKSWVYFSLFPSFVLFVTRLNGEHTKTGPPTEFVLLYSSTKRKDVKVKEQLWIENGDMKRDKENSRLVNQVSITA